MTSKQTPTETVRSFWNEVWNMGQTDRINEFMTDDFVIHTAGNDVTPRTQFIQWVEGFQEKIENLKFHIHDILESGNVVTTRWTITGNNKGFMETSNNEKPINLSGITISVVTENGRFQKSGSSEVRGSCIRRFHEANLLR